jgi:outer membrane lipoprotein-sorting protein
MTRIGLPVVLGRAASVVAATLALATVAVAPPARADATDAGPAPPATVPDSREKLEGAKLDAVLADVARARRGVRTMRASFVQERKLTLLATTVRSTGELAYVAPERLRWELAPPDDVVYFIGPEGLSYRTRTSHATTAAQGANVAKALADLRALLGGDLALLKDRYVLGGSRNPNGSDVEISGTAKDKTATVRGFTLTLDKTLVLPVRARLLEGKSDAIEITFSNGQINVPIDPATMKP